jgi:hypothetical protein
VNGDLNFEKKDEYSVRVVATDGDDPTLSSYVDVTIKINDVNDKPTYEEKEYVFEIHEKHLRANLSALLLPMMKIPGVFLVMIFLIT